MDKLTRAQKATITKIAAQIIDTQDQNLARHRRLCEICKHPACFLIEEAFLQWTSPEVIIKKFTLKSRTSVYHHAHTLKLFERRDRTLRFALGHLIEQADRVKVSARDVIQAVYTYAHINDDGLWTQPSSKSEIVVSKNEPSAAPPGPSLDCLTAPARQPAKPASRRRRPRHAAAVTDFEKPAEQADADLLAAYRQAAGPDNVGFPNAPEDPAAAAAAAAAHFFRHVPRPNREPSLSQNPVLIDTNQPSPEHQK